MLALCILIFPAWFPDSGSLVQRKENKINAAEHKIVHFHHTWYKTLWRCFRQKVPPLHQAAVPISSSASQHHPWIFSGLSVAPKAGKKWKKMRVSLLSQGIRGRTRGDGPKLHQGRLRLEFPHGKGGQALEGAAQGVWSAQPWRCHLDVALSAPGLGTAWTRWSWGAFPASGTLGFCAHPQFRAAHL